MIQLLDIHKIYGSVTANDGVTLKVRAGSIHALLGENGAGKSTLMKILSGFVPRTSGRIVINGRDVNISSPTQALKAGIGMLYQDCCRTYPIKIWFHFHGFSSIIRKTFSLFPGQWHFFVPGSRMEEGLISGLTITEHAALNRSGSSLLFRKKQAMEQALKTIEKFAIKATPDSLVDSLSGGNQQRVLLSLLPDDPKVLLLENPTRGLDHDSTLAVWDILLSRCRISRTAVIFSSSELDEILQIADRILVFSNGELMMDRPCHDVNRNDIGLAVVGVNKLS